VALPTIRYDGLDITSTVIFRDAIFATQVNGRPGECQFRIRDETLALAMTTGKPLTLDVGGVRVWTGYVAKVRRVYAFPAFSTPNARLFQVEGVDVNILFLRRYVFKQSDPAHLEGPTYTGVTSDTTALTELLSNWLDLSGDGIDTSSLVGHVGNINIDQPAYPWSGSFTWGQAMTEIAKIEGAIFYIDPQKRLVYTDVDTPNAPFGVSDRPTAGQVGFREGEILFDGGGLINDFMGWGISGAAPQPIFKRVEDSASIAAHGLWQFGGIYAGVWKQPTLDKIANTSVYGSPNNKRGAKDDRVAIEVVVLEPGFVAGQKVAFESEAFGYSDVIPIRRMEIRFPTPADAFFKLLLSHEIDELGFMDPWPPFRWGPPPFSDFTIPPFGGIPPIPPIPPIPVPPGCGPAGAGSRFDNFNRSVSSGWGTSDAGYEWTSHGAATTSVNGFFGLARITQSDEMDFDIVNSTGPWALAAGFLMRARINLGQVYSFDSGSDDPRTNTDIYFDFGGPATLQLNVDNGAASNRGFIKLVIGSGGPSFTKKDWLANTPYIVELEFRPSTTCRARIYVDGTVPPDWQVVDPLPASTSPDSIRIHSNTFFADDASVLDFAIDWIEFGPSGGCGVVDSFTRVVAPNGWGVSDAGVAWTVNDGLHHAAVFEVADGVGVIINEAAFNTVIAGYGGIYEFPLPFDIMFDVSMTNIPSTGGVLRINVGGDNSALALDLLPATDLARIQNGDFSTGIEEITTELSIPLTVRLAKVLSGTGTVLSAKIWPVGMPEPSNWMISDQSARNRDNYTILAFEVSQQSVNSNFTVAIDNLQCGGQHAVSDGNCVDDPLYPQGGPRVTPGTDTCENFIADGATTDFTLKAGYMAGTLVVSDNGEIKERAVDWVETSTVGGQFHLNYTPASGHTIRACYFATTSTGGVGGGGSVTRVI
jgi:hypothetical protein